MSYFGIPIRNGLPIGLGSVAPLASGGGSPFSPLSLFSAGAPGAWYDPSDYGATGTLFQDSAGTTPVTAVEQPVGLMLDKSQGLVLGPELVTNGDFSNGSTDWILSAGVTVSGGTANWTALASNSSARQTGILTVGKTYQVTYTISSISSGGFKVSIGAEGPIYTSAGTYTARLTASLTQISILSQGASTTGSIDNISVKELPGNHAFQSTSASRPVLSARYNLLTKTEDFSDAAWVKSAGATVTANTTTAPNGTVTADTLVSPSGNWVRQPTSIPAAVIRYTQSIYVKANASTSFGVTEAGLTGSSASFTLSGAGSISIVDAGGSPTATITNVGDGWYLCTFSYTSNGVQTTLFLNNDSPSAFIWGASLLPSNQSTLPYQRVNTSTDYDTVGFLPYLKFDGVDDSLSTNSISFTSTDKMSVFAGVRKLSDPVEDFIASFGGTSADSGFEVQATAFASSPKGFGIQSTGPGYGSGFVNNVLSPTTQVYVGTLNRKQATSAATYGMRLNGVAQALSYTGVLPTGNFGNYPLYIGRRVAAGPFNGQLYSMVIVGKAVTAGELSSTETYVATKTGVVLA